MLRRIVLALAVLASACAAPNPSVTPSPAPTREPGAVNVTALLDLSGSRAPAGGPQRDALQLWADQHAGSTPRVRLRIVDVGGNDAKTALELRRAAVDERADAIIVGVTIDYDDAFARAVQLAQVPVLFTLPIREPAVAGGGWAFALAPTPAQLAKVALDDAARRFVLSGGQLVSDESTSAIIERAALTAELSRRNVAANLVTVGAGDATQRIRPMLATTSFVLFAGAPKSYVEGARSATAGTSLYLSYLCDLGDIADLRDATSLATWPGSRQLAGPPSPGSARAAFVQTYTDRAGTPTTVAATAYDALTLISIAAEGILEPARVRDRLQSGTFSGIATTYSFSTSRHAGFASSDVVLLRYTGIRSAPALRS
jgi:hypothetical protein